MERLKVDSKSIKIIDIQYKEFDKNNFFKLKNSLQRFGQTRPINTMMINKQICCFEGRRILAAVNELNIEEIEINLWDINLENRVNLQLIMNDLNFETNDIKLSEVLNIIKDIDVGKLPFNKEVFEDYLKLINFDWEEYSRQEVSTQINLFDI